MNEYKLNLLKSMIKSPKYLHMGKTSVPVIQACFELEKEDYLWSDADGWVHITQKGREEVVKSGKLWEEE